MSFSIKRAAMSDFNFGGSIDKQIPQNVFYHSSMHFQKALIRASRSCLYWRARRECSCAVIRFWSCYSETIDTKRSASFLESRKALCIGIWRYSRRAAADCSHCADVGKATVQNACRIHVLVFAFFDRMRLVSLRQFLLFGEPS